MRFPYFFNKLVFLFLFSSPLFAQTSDTLPLAKSLVDKISNSAVFEKGFSGFAFYDPSDSNYIAEYRSQNYFTPASNVKIWTLLTAVSILKDSMPVIFYEEKPDTLLLWGTGYPLLLHPDFEGQDTLLTWLRERPEQTILFSNANFKDDRFGEGWSWDDFPYGYQMEKSALPIYGNRVQFSKTGHLGKIEITPDYFSNTFVFDRLQSATISRFEDRNIFTFGPRALRARKLDRRIPFRVDPLITTDLLAAALDKKVIWTSQALPEQATTLYAPVPDTLYRKFMQSSDNFLSEQLLLLCSAKRYGNMNTAQLLAYAQDTLFREIPTAIDWVDGSGLSRYNQITPAAMIWALEKLQQIKSLDWQLKIFPAGGKSGTITNRYKGAKGEPFVFAKTGTLRHIHCLSGYVKVQSGKTLLFSFMHNNFPDKISELRVEMEEILNWIKANF